MSEVLGLISRKDETRHYSTVPYPMILPYFQLTRAIAKLMSARERCQPPVLFVEIFPGRDGWKAQSPKLLSKEQIARNWLCETLTLGNAW